MIAARHPPASRPPPVPTTRAQISVPEIDDEYVEAQLYATVLGVRSVKGFNFSKKRKMKHQISFAQYDTETYMIKLQLGVTIYKNSTRVGGARAPGPPPGSSAGRPIPGRWLPQGMPAPTPAELQQAYALPDWPHGF